MFRYMQSQHMLLTVSHWCQLIDGMSQQRQKGTRAYELPYTLWVELQQTGLVLDAWSFTTGMLVGPFLAHSSKLSACRVIDVACLVIVVFLLYGVLCSQLSTGQYVSSAGRTATRCCTINACCCRPPGALLEVEICQ